MDVSVDSQPRPDTLVTRSGLRTRPQPYPELTQHSKSSPKSSLIQLSTTQLTPLRSAKECLQLGEGLAEPPSDFEQANFAGMILVTGLLWEVSTDNPPVPDFVDAGNITRVQSNTDLGALRDDRSEASSEATAVSDNPFQQNLARTLLGLYQSGAIHPTDTPVPLPPIKDAGRSISILRSLHSISPSVDDRWNVWKLGLKVSEHLLASEPPQASSPSEEAVDVPIEWRPLATLAFRAGSRQKSSKNSSAAHSARTSDDEFSESLVVTRKSRSPLRLVVKTDVPFPKTSDRFPRSPSPSSPVSFRSGVPARSRASSVLSRLSLPSRVHSLLCTEDVKTAALVSTSPIDTHQLGSFTPGSPARESGAAASLRRSIIASSTVSPTYTRPRIPLPFTPFRTNSTPSPPRHRSQKSLPTISRTYSSISDAETPSPPSPGTPIAPPGTPTSFLSPGQPSRRGRGSSLSHLRGDDAHCMSQGVPLDPLLAALENASRLRARVTCAVCGKVGSDYPRCGKCGDAWCSRECRLHGSDGKRHVCRSTGLTQK